MKEETTLDAPTTDVLAQFRNLWELVQSRNPVKSNDGKYVDLTLTITTYGYEYKTPTIAAFLGNGCRVSASSVSDLLAKMDSYDPAFENKKRIAELREELEAREALDKEGGAK